MHGEIIDKNTSLSQCMVVSDVSLILNSLPQMNPQQIVLPTILLRNNKPSIYRFQLLSSTLVPFLNTKTKSWYLKNPTHFEKTRVNTRMLLQDRLQLIDNLLGGTKRKWPQKI